MMLCFFSAIRGMLVLAVAVAVAVVASGWRRVAENKLLVGNGIFQLFGNAMETEETDVSVGRSAAKVYGIHAAGELGDLSTAAALSYGFEAPVTRGGAAVSIGGVEASEDAIPSAATAAPHLSTPDCQPATGGAMAVSSPDATPNLLESFSALRSQFIDKQLFIFLDYDGTLTPIVQNPCDALLPEETRDVLSGLSEQYTVTIVTGRALKTIKDFVKITPNEELKFMYAASHGFHIEAGARNIHHQVGQQHVPALREAAERIASHLLHIPGLLLEDNEFAFSVHYRNVPAELVDEVESMVDAVLGYYPALKKSYGKKVFEIRINVEWDKGRAVLWLMEAMGVSPFDERVVVIYIGDDVTDEDAFRAVKICPNGLGVLVSPDARPTEAVLHLNDTVEVLQFLRQLLFLRSS